MRSIRGVGPRIDDNLIDCLPSWVYNKSMRRCATRFSCVYGWNCARLDRHVTWFTIPSLMTRAGPRLLVVYVCGASPQQTPAARDQYGENGRSQKGCRREIEEKIKHPCCSISRGAWSIDDRPRWDESTEQSTDGDINETGRMMEKVSFPQQSPDPFDSLQIFSPVFLRTCVKLIQFSGLHWSRPNATEYIYMIPE
jgi:hypothetical protein